MLFLTETWLKPQITNSMVNIPDFNLIRSDRLSSKGGGVALYHNKCLNIKELEKPSISTNYSNFDFLPIDLLLDKTSFRIICFYIPPCSSICHQTIRNVCSTIESFLQPTVPTILLGDFNLPKIDWENMSAVGVSTSSNEFLKFCLKHGLNQLVTSPTHKDGNILDLILCNTTANSIIISSQVDCPISSTCDHNTLSFSLPTIFPKKHSCPNKYPNFRKADFDLINHSLSLQPWNAVLQEKSVQKKYDVFIDIILNSIDKYVPMKSNKSKDNKRLPKHLKIIFIKIKATHLQIIQKR